MGNLRDSTCSAQSVSPRSLQRCHPRTMAPGRNRLIVLSSQLTFMLCPAAADSPGAELKWPTVTRSCLSPRCSRLHSYPLYCAVTSSWLCSRCYTYTHTHTLSLSLPLLPLGRLPCPTATRSSPVSTVSASLVWPSSLARCVWPCSAALGASLRLLCYPSKSILFSKSLRLSYVLLLIDC